MRIRADAKLAIEQHGVTAERKLELVIDGKPHEVTLQIGKPYLREPNEDGGELGACPYSITGGFDEPFYFQVPGIDSMQALLLAIDGARGDLRRLEESSGGVLCRLMYQGAGFGEADSWQRMKLRSAVTREE